MLRPNTQVVPALREPQRASPRQSGATGLRSKRERTNRSTSVRVVVLTIDEELLNLIERAAMVRGVPSATYMREVLSAQAHIDVAEYAVVGQGSMRRSRLVRLSSPKVQAALSALLDALASPKE